MAATASHAASQAIGAVIGRAKGSGGLSPAPAWSPVTIP